MIEKRKYEAERLRLGLGGGWIELTAAVAWADEEIARQPHRDPVLIDISLAGHQHREDIEGCSLPCPGK